MRKYVKRVSKASIHTLQVRPVLHAPATHISLQLEQGVLPHAWLVKVESIQRSRLQYALRVHVAKRQVLLFLIGNTI